MNEMAYVLQAWLPLIVWQQVDAPQYQKGYITITCLSVCLITTSVTIRYLHQRELRTKSSGDEVSSRVESDGIGEAEREGVKLGGKGFEVSV